MIENDSEECLIGYARVSTVGQTLDSQLEQLRGAGCTKIYREKVTGARADRRQLLDMLKHLGARRRGDRDAHSPAGAQHL
jgi:DNA invertase Pin-like site-specific DNA recombinase